MIPFLPSLTHLRLLCRTELLFVSLTPHLPSPSFLSSSLSLSVSLLCLRLSHLSSLSPPYLPLLLSAVTPLNLSFLVLCLSVLVSWFFISFHVLHLSVSLCLSSTHSHTHRWLCSHLFTDRQCSPPPPALFLANFYLSFKLLPEPPLRLREDFLILTETTAYPYAKE